VERGLILFLWVGLGALALAAPVQGLVERHVVVVSSRATDARLVAVQEAIVFWNETLSSLGLRTRLVASDPVAPGPVGRALENYTRHIWQQAGRLRAGPSTADEPPELESLGGDVVLFLSVQPTMSFAWPLPAGRYFVAVPSDPGTRFARVRSLRNVVAHELGHTLGLSHRPDRTVLMCSPCRPDVAPTDSRGFFFLTEVDRQRLRELP
jgi:hypothetical protein